MRDMNLHNPPPEDIFRDLGETQQHCVVTLSYFIEPNPGKEAENDIIISHSDYVDIQTPYETRDQFRSRINNLVREENHNPIQQ